MKFEGKNRNGTIRKLGKITLSIVVTAMMALPAGGAFAATLPKTAGATISPQLINQLKNFSSGDHPGAGSQWFYQQRAAIGGTISQRAYTGSLAQAAVLQHAAAQNIQNHQLSVGQAPFGPFQNLGPSPIQNETVNGQTSSDSGRVTSVRIGANGTLYIGSAGGGVWGSTDGGSSWKELTSGFLSNGQAIPSQAIGALAVIPGSSSATDTIFAGTGEYDSAIDAMYGQGILFSTDGGSSWSLLGNSQTVFAGNYISHITIDQQLNPNHDPYGTIFVSASNGLFESQDGGVTFTPVTVSPTLTQDGAGFSDVKVQPGSNGNTVYAVVPVTALGNQNDIADAGLYMSTNGGQSFSHVMQGLPSGVNFDIGKLAISPTNSQIEYLAVSTANPKLTFGSLTGVYMSTNGGVSWNLIQGVPNYFGKFYYYGYGNSAQGWYDNTILVNPADPYNLILGGIGLAEVEVAVNSAGQPSVVPGSSYNLTTEYGIHPDQHSLAVDANGNLIIGNDGGVWEITPSGQMNDLNTNLSLTQFYPGISTVDQGQVVLAGSQDNGTVIGDVYQGDPWIQIAEGDGTWTGINPQNPSLLYTENPNGKITGFDIANQIAFSAYPQQMKNANWVAPFVLDPSNPSTMYAGDNQVFKSTDGGQTYSVTTNVYNPTYGNVSAMAISPSDPNVLYAAWSNVGATGSQSIVEMSQNGGATWTSLGTFQDYITSLTVDPQDPYALFETMSGYYPYVYPLSQEKHVLFNPQTNLSNSSWINISGNLPNAPVNKLIVDGSYLLVGTDTGVYSTNYNSVYPTSPNSLVSPQWVGVGQGLPMVPVVDMKLLSSGKLLVATHGLGMWTANPLHLTQVLSLSQTTGPISGGNWITITGTGFDGATSVTFSDSQFTTGTSMTVSGSDVKVINNNVLQVLVPADSYSASSNLPETVDVQVNGPYGVSSMTPSDQYTYGGSMVLSAAPGVGVSYVGQPVSVTGNVYFDSGSAAGSPVTITDGIQTKTVTTDVYGNFNATFQTPTQPSNLWFYAFSGTQSSTTAPVYANASLAVIAGSPTSISLQSSVGSDVISEGGIALVTGVVQDVYNNPVPDASVTLTDSQNNAISPVVTDTNGQFTASFYPSTPGVDSVQASVYGASGFITSPTLNLVVSSLNTNHIPASISFQPVSLNALVNSSVTLHGLVTDQNGNPVSGAPITLSSIGGNLSSGTVYSNSKGQFSVDLSTPKNAGIISVAASTQAAGNAVVGNTQINVYGQPTLSASTLPAGNVGAVYSTNLPITGDIGTYMWNVSNGILPSGLTLTSGMISGIPTQVGKYTFTVAATDQYGTSTSQTYEINVLPSVLPAISTQSFTSPTVGTMYSVNLSDQGGIAPLTWSATGLPAGLAINGNAISGVPTASGTFTVELTVTDSAGNSATKKINLVVQPASVSSGGSPVTTGGFGGYVGVIPPVTVSGSSSGGAGTPPAQVGTSTSTSTTNASQFSTKLVSQTVDQNGSTLTQSSGNSNVNVTIPVGAFSSPETVSLTTETVKDAGSILKSLPSGSFGVVLFGVNFSGAAPIKPITLTINNSNIQPGEVVYKEGTNGKLIPVSAQVIAGQAVIQFTNDPNFVVAAPAKPVLPTLAANQRGIVWGYNQEVVPVIVKKDPNTQVTTTFMPIWYVMQSLNGFGIKSQWTGKDLKLETSSGTYTITAISDHGNMSIQINGTQVLNVPGFTAKDPTHGNMTTYMPIWYIMQTLKELNLQSSWNGNEWTISQNSTLVQ